MYVHVYVFELACMRACVRTFTVEASFVEPTFVELTVPSQVRAVGTQIHDRRADARARTEEQERGQLRWMKLEG